MNTLESAPSVPLPQFTENVRRNIAISWYRTKLSPAEIKSLHTKSDIQGAIQTLGYLILLVLLGVGAFYSSQHAPWEMTVTLIFLYGMVASFFLNAVHELGHGTVFRTKQLNIFFCHLFAFLSWTNHEMFQTSHIRHHRFTLHPPDDLEVVLPIKPAVWHAFKTGLFYPWGFFRHTLPTTVRIACGRFEGEWEKMLYPEKDLESRKIPVRWARILLAGHTLIMIGSVISGQWIIPVLVSGSQMYGSWLFFFCNNTQHVGLKDNIDDFRLCCRTFTLNPLVRFLYWQMNFHIEHHMYAAVPCYNLPRLHRLIKHDLPPTPKGLVAVWKEIDDILRKQTIDPTYQHTPALPRSRVNGEPA